MVLITLFQTMRFIYWWEGEGFGVLPGAIIPVGGKIKAG